MSNPLGFITSSFKKLKIIDFFILGCLVALGIVTLFFILRKTTQITVRVRITDRDVIFVYNNPPSWYANLFQKGMAEKDFLGRTTAEVIEAYSYDGLSDYYQEAKLARKTIYLTVKIHANYNRQTQQYSYKGLPVAAGESIRLNLGNVSAYGLITELDGVGNNYELVTKIVKVQIKQETPVYPGTSGVDPAVAEAFFVGDKVIDSASRAVVEILKKEVVPAALITVDSLGRSRYEFHPWKKNVFLTLRLVAKKINQELFYFDDFPIKINVAIPLYFPRINAVGTILEISDN